jgi:hypothetical protein
VVGAKVSVAYGRTQEKKMWGSRTLSEVDRKRDQATNNWVLHVKVKVSRHTTEQFTLGQIEAKTHCRALATNKRQGSSDRGSRAGEASIIEVPLV